MRLRMEAARYVDRVDYLSMSWIWPTYVDRELPLTKEQRKAIHRDAWRLWMRNRWNFLIYLTLPISYVFVLPVARDLMGRLASWAGVGGMGYKSVRAFTIFAITIAFFVLGGAVFQRFRFAPLVYRVTRRHGHDVCPKCGYWLRGLNDDVKRCPECGQERSAAL